jgi:hypothetical protein
VNTKNKIAVVCLPFAFAIGLLGCPEKSSGGGAGSASAAPSAPASPDTAAQPTAQASPTDGGKPVAIPLPRLNVDAAAGLIDAAVALLDGGLPAPPTATDAGGASAGGAVPAECGQYATQQNVCIGKMPAAAQGPARAALAAAQASWPAQAGVNAAALQVQCKGLLAAAMTCK